MNSTPAIRPLGEAAEANEDVLDRWGDFEHVQNRMRELMEAHGSEGRGTQRQEPPARGRS
ncbi:hypothetical protein ACFYYB_26565 [Streptomyces sp. NPDC002886]|uniref:hypothetical protein n=1 Tax=Streptomyces sp. NPDC002886 TaxID=3364667 RepID=UPI003691B2C3